MIIPKHRRTIYIEDNNFSVKEKFLLNLPKLEFIKVRNGSYCSYRCLAIEDGEQFIPPFLNCDSWGYICFGAFKFPKLLKDAVEQFFTTSFNFESYDSMMDYCNESNKMIELVKETISFYKDWEKTGKVKLRQIS